MKENDKRLNAYKKIAEFKPQKITREEISADKKSFTPFNLADYAVQKQFPASENKNYKKEIPVQEKLTAAVKKTAAVEQTIPDNKTEKKTIDQNSINDYMDRRGLIKVA